MGPAREQLLSPCDLITAIIALEVCCGVSREGYRRLLVVRIKIGLPADEPTLPPLLPLAA